MTEFSEAEMIAPALDIMAKTPNGFITTTDLIAQLRHCLKPDGKDVAILTNRNDDHFSQKVRNLVSHRKEANGLECRSLAVYDDDRQGWTITQKGRDFI
ncbi:hypothetical protein N5853_08965 [Bartonella sp. HY329]|uniref:hypothetical protein n=1 Tax=unclassified Bartonella TaxID=2645622 RepID=UPI0021CAC769|nr:MULTISPECIES: hypothetical protein [unclassified Bartonella]UXM94239.1 hypothetical protein N5853_08965 [Bartonella sp. HY329]UXN08562.1 hypothetical protein N5852_08975 [Bartonella sp. HY328]